MFDSGVLRLAVFRLASSQGRVSFTETSVRCRYDYASQIDILPENEVMSFLGRGTFQLNADTQIFAEASWAKQTSTFRISQTPASEATTKKQPDGTTLPLLYPEGGKYYPGNGIVPAVASRPVTGDLNIYWRALETGPRTNEVETDEYRILLGISGLAWGWDYNAGTYYISSEATETYLAGYLLESKLLPTMYTGVINPFGYNDAAGLGGAEFDPGPWPDAHGEDHRVGDRRRRIEGDHEPAGRPDGTGRRLPVPGPGVHRYAVGNPRFVGHHRRRGRAIR